MIPHHCVFGIQYVVVHSIFLSSIKKNLFIALINIVLLNWGVINEYCFKCLALGQSNATIQ